MLDWKILAASIVALLVISSVFIGGLGIRETLSGIIGKISDYLGTSPFGGLLPSTPAPGEQEGSKEVSILLLPDSITLHPDAEATLTSGDMHLTGFTGDIGISFENGTVELQASTLSITFPLETLSIHSLVLNSLTADGINLEIQPDLSTDSGGIEMKGFSGFATATSRGLELHGTVSSLIVTIGSNRFELV